MKKIHNISDLRHEKKIVEQRILQLEKELQHDWNDVKQDLSIQSNSFFGNLKNRYMAKLAMQGISFAAGMLARKFGGKIGNRIYSWLK